MLARGYEYQEDNALNKVLLEPDLDATTYKIWLDNNAVGYVAISSTERRDIRPSTRSCRADRPGYLARIWHDDDWTVYRVAHATPIVDRAGHESCAFSQSKLVLRVPCACTFAVRVRKPEEPAGGHDPAAGPPGADRAPARTTGSAGRR